MLRLFERQSDNECGALSRRASGRDAAPVTIGDLAANGQADAGPLVGAATVQPLEKNEDAVEIFLVETNAVILDHDLAKLFRRSLGGGFSGGLRKNPAADFDDGRFAFLMKFERIADQVLEQLAHLQRVGVN